jgi:hypothetical protein
MQRNLAVKSVRKQPALAVVDGNTSFIARSFKTENSHSRCGALQKSGRHHKGDAPTKIEVWPVFKAKWLQR